MLTFSFFTAVFLTISWIMYIGAYLFSRLQGIAFHNLGLTDLTIYTALTIVPLVVIWMIWGACYRFYHEKNLQKQFKSIELKLQQNQEFFEIATRLFYQAQKNRENHFILSQTELFIAELNGMIADILQRYKFITESEAAKLWMATEKGNKWCFAKALIDLQNSSTGFKGQLYRTAQREKLLRGNINEFCARYARLLEMLKAHDKDRIFLDIVETGALGKAFAILAPLSDKLQESAPLQEELFDFEDAEKQEKELVADAEMKIAQIGEQKNNIKSDTQQKTQTDQPSKHENISLPEFLNTTENKAEAHPTLETSLTNVSVQNEQDIIADNNQTLEETVAAINALSEKEEEKSQPTSEENILPNKTEENALEDEIGRMFDGAGIREYPQENDDEVKSSIFPKFSNLFKKKNQEKVDAENKTDAETDIISQSGIDPLTLALERSFGKLADDNLNQNSRLYQAMNSDNNKNNDEQTGGEEKFSFATTNETLMKLQQELAELSGSDNNPQTSDNKGEHVDKKEN